MTKCREELTAKCQELERAVRETSPELSAKTDPHGFRDYQARLSVAQRKQYIGHILLAYSPNRALYTANLAAIRDAQASSALCEICAAVGCLLARDARQPRQPGPTPQGNSAANRTRIEQAKTAADLLLEALADSGMQAEFVGVYNHYVRMNLFVNGGGAPTRIDIYNTARHQLDLRITTPPADNKAAARIHELWEPIRAKVLSGSSSDSASQSPDAAMKRSTLYYETLRKYAEYDFDFIDLAMALEDIARRRQIPFPDVSDVRYDFAILELYYRSMGGNPKPSPAKIATKKPPWPNGTRHMAHWGHRT